MHNKCAILMDDRVIFFAQPSLISPASGRYLIKTGRQKRASIGQAYYRLVIGSMLTATSGR